MFGQYKNQLALRLFTVAITALILAGLIAPAFATATLAAPAALACKTNHTVKNSETLESIAKKYNITVDALAKANDMSKSAKLYKRQVLCIPAANKSEAQAALSVQASKGNLSLSAAKISKSTPYLLKVKEGDRGFWYTLGRLQSTKDGSLTAKNFTLPKDLRTKLYLTVCLKNQLTDQLTCQKVYHIP